MSSEQVAAWSRRCPWFLFGGIAWLALVVLDYVSFGLIIAVMSVMLGTGCIGIIHPTNRCVWPITGISLLIYFPLYMALAITTLFDDPLSSGLLLAIEFSIGLLLLGLLVRLLAGITRDNFRIYCTSLREDGRPQRLRYLLDLRWETNLVLLMNCARDFIVVGLGTMVLYLWMRFG